MVIQAYKNNNAGHQIDYQIDKANYVTIFYWLEFWELLIHT